MNERVAAPSFHSYGGTAPENYERYFVPAIGLPLATALVESAALSPGERVLDVACGTGVVARLAADQVGAAGSVTGLDVNPGMLAVARSVSSPAAIEWRESNAEDTQLPDAAYDTALCQMGLQFFSDRGRAMAELSRALVPGGRLVANVPGPIPEVFQILHRAIGDHVSPEVAKFISVVFSLEDPRRLEELVSGSGFREVSVRRDPRVLRLPPPEDFLWQYVWSTPLAAAVGTLGDHERETLKRDVLAGWEGLADDGALILQLDVLTVVAKRAV
ncbi:MAG TPA: methyltransferase domain-containing protein [Thermoleophilaceae bacterium]